MTTSSLDDVQDHRQKPNWSQVDLEHNRTDLPIDMIFNDGHRLSVTVYSVLMVVSSIGNFTVLILLILRRLKNPSRIDAMLMHLAIADLLVTSLMMALEIGWAITVSWKAGDLMCRLMAFFRTFGLYLSSFVLVCISIDRYFAVSLSVLFRTKRSTYKRTAYGKANRSNLSFTLYNYRFKNRENVYISESIDEVSCEKGVIKARLKLAKLNSRDDSVTVSKPGILHRRNSIDTPSSNRNPDGKNVEMENVQLETVNDNQLNVFVKPRKKLSFKEPVVCSRFFDLKSDTIPRATKFLEEYEEQRSGSLDFELEVGVSLHRQHRVRMLVGSEVAPFKPYFDTTV